jgi:hypothetical protein
MCATIKQALESRYPPGSTITCWYPPGDPGNFELELRWSGLWLVFFIAWISIGSIPFVSWLSCAIKRHRASVSYTALASVQSQSN